MDLKNKNFIFGYDNNPSLVFRSAPAQNFFVKPGVCSRKPFDFRAETQIAAREIYSKYSDAAVLCLSGGLDSEIMAESFIYSGTPFRAVIMRFEDDKNIHDISWAISYCENRNVPYEFFDIDVAEFFKSGEYLSYAQPSQCGYPFILLHLRMLETILATSRVPILGEGNMHFRFSQNRWHYHTQEFWYAHEKFFNRNHEAVIKFYHWSPELMLSYLLNPRLMGYFRQPNPGLTSLNSIKHVIYSDFYNCGERKKYRGYEKLMSIHQQYFSLLQQQLGLKDTVATIDVDVLLRTLYPKEL